MQTNGYQFTIAVHAMLWPYRSSQMPTISAVPDAHVVNQQHIAHSAEVVKVELPATLGWSSWSSRVWSGAELQSYLYQIGTEFKRYLA